MRSNVASNTNSQNAALQIQKPQPLQVSRTLNKKCTALTTGAGSAKTTIMLLHD
jgi:hypothetical protein